MRDELLDLLVKEQLLLTLLEDVHIWVTERKPKSSQEAGELADNYLQARSSIDCEKVETPQKDETPRKDETPLKDVTPQKDETPGRNEKLPSTRCPKCGLYGHPRQDITLSKTTGRDVSKCYLCNEKGHLAYQCPQRTSLYCEERTCTDTVTKHKSLKHGLINGAPCDVPGHRNHTEHGSFRSPHSR